MRSAAVTISSIEKLSDTISRLNPQLQSVASNESLDAVSQDDVGDSNSHMRRWTSQEDRVGDTLKLRATLSSEYEADRPHGVSQLASVPGTIDRKRQTASARIERGSRSGSEHRVRGRRWSGRSPQRRRRRRSSAHSPSPLAGNDSVASMESDLILNDSGASGAVGDSRASIGESVLSGGSEHTFLVSPRCG